MSVHFSVFESRSPKMGQNGSKLVFFTFVENLTMELVYVNDFNNDFNKLLNTIEYFCKNYISRKYLVLGLGAKKKGYQRGVFPFFSQKVFGGFLFFFK